MCPFERHTILSRIRRIYCMPLYKIVRRWCRADTCRTGVERVASTEPPRGRRTGSEAVRRDTDDTSDALRVECDKRGLFRGPDRNALSGQPPPPEATVGGASVVSPHREAVRSDTRVRNSDFLGFGVVHGQQPRGHQPSSDRDQPVVESATEDALFVLAAVPPRSGERTHQDRLAVDQ